METKMISKRGFLYGGFGAAAALSFGPLVRAGSPARGGFRVSLSDAEWKCRLTEEEYYILREAGTERAFTSPLNEEKRRGVFTCAGCDNEVYTSATKFESGTGWPSFYAPADAGAVGTSADRSLLMLRTEVHCADCGGHLGHIFDDGPPPTGKRHCINGAALNFTPKPKKKDA
jgi:peptide-methionine (R)-S-oxide reductase|tara:strand:+ start:26168 stop:26686 length:519 start_codon:yes stop_codon:yes gene_type:complete